MGLWGGKCLTESYFSFGEFWQQIYTAKAFMFDMVKRQRNRYNMMYICCISDVRGKNTEGRIRYV